MQSSYPAPPPPAAVQFIGQLAFGIVAIIATVMAFDASWIAGVIVILVLGSVGFGGRGERFRGWRSDRAQPVAPVACEPAPTGNAAFDAHRAQVLKRLEEEQKSFVAFLDRLRAARDASELDSFMADRARTNATGVADAARTGEY